MCGLGGELGQGLGFVQGRMIRLCPGLSFLQGRSVQLQRLSQWVVLWVQNGGGL